MATNRGLFSWIIIAILFVVGLAVGWSIWSSLQETRAKLKAQEATMRELEIRDVAVKRYADSLDAVVATLGEREKVLIGEREELQQKLEQVQREFRKTRARSNHSLQCVIEFSHGVIIRLSGPVDFALLAQLIHSPAV